jgi:Cthe_2314-like HEPN
MNKDRSAFDDRVIKDYIPHIIKLVINTGSDGEEPQALINCPAYKYVEDVQDKLSKVNEAIKQCQIVARQVEIPPPNDWLNNIGLTLADHFEKQLNDATLFLFSISDKSLLLINSVLDLKIDPRKCRHKNVEARITDNADLLKALQQLNLTVKPLEDLRNFYVHRGESRRTDLLEIFSLIQKVSQRREFRPDQDVQLYTQKQLLETISSEITKMEAVVEEIKGALLSQYSKRLEELGGIIMPNGEELNEFREILETIVSTEPAEIKIAPELLGLYKVH